MIETLSDAEIQSQLNTTRYLILIPFSILIYDYALTFGQEFSRYWGTTLTWGTFLFFLNRYFELLGTIPIAVSYMLTTSDPRKRAVRMLCNGFTMYHSYFALLSQILVAVILITRTYALYERSKIVLAFTVLVTLAAIVFALSILLRSSVQDTLDPRLAAIGCPTPSPHASDLERGTAWAGMLIFDVMIFSLTVYKAFRHGARGRAGNLFHILLRDGTLYFGIMIACNAANIGTYTMGGPILSGSAATLTNVLSSVLISRLMLNVRDPRIGHRDHPSSLSTTTRDLSRMTSALGMSTYLRDDPDLGTGTDIALDDMWLGRSRHGRLDPDTGDDGYRHGNGKEDRRNYASARG